MTDRLIRATSIAEADIRSIDSWWREHRSAAPDLFIDEMLLAASLLQSFPQLGKRYPAARVPRLRRYLLRASRYHIYYLASPDEVLVLTVWGAVRGTTPNFKAIADADTLKP
jgi:plasmid stabilization system protein ParE